MALLDDGGALCIVTLKRKTCSGKINKVEIKGVNVEYIVVNKKNAVVDCIEENDAKEVEAILEVEIKEACMSRFLEN